MHNSPPPIYAILQKVRYTADQANQININGDIQNSAIGNGNTASLTTNNINESKSSSFWKGIWQKIVANALWWGIGFIVVATGIATYFKQGIGK